MATGVQIATLVAAVLSATGSCATATATYLRFQRETARPVLAFNWGSNGLRITVRNRSSGTRTVYSVGFVLRPSWSGSARSLMLHEPEKYGPALPVTLNPGESATWGLPYSMIRIALDQRPRFSRHIHAIADLGDDFYLKQVPREPYRLALKATPSEGEVQDFDVGEGKVSGETSTGYL